MSKFRLGARAGAAAFVLGAALIAPQATGVAAADDLGEAQSSSPNSGQREAKSSAQAGKPAMGHLPLAGRAARARGSVAATDTPQHRKARIGSGAVSSAAGPVGALPTVAPHAAAVPDGPVGSTANRAAIAADSAATDVTVVTPAAAARGEIVSPTKAAGVATAAVNPLASIDAAVTHWFDSVSTWLSGLPSTGLTAWLQGAVLLVRRTAFNHAPTATYTQTGLSNSGELLGQINAADLEGDAVTYRVTQNPNSGTVSVDNDGQWVYTPGSNFTGTDTFTVAIDNPARLNILDPTNNPTLLNIAVEAPLGKTEAFFIVNYSSYRVQYTGSYDGYRSGWDSTPTVNNVYSPGDYAQFELTEPFGGEEYGSAYFKAVVDPFGHSDSTLTQWWGMGAEADGLNDSYVRGCDSNSACTYEPHHVYLLDPPGTFYDIPALNKEVQSYVLDTFCRSGGPSSCKFVPSGDRPIFEPADLKPATVQQTLSPGSFRNPGESPVSYSESVTLEASQSSSVTLDESVSVNIYSAVEAAISRSQTETWTQSTSWSVTASWDVPAHTRLDLYAEYPVISVTGDFIVTLGNTTYILRDVVFNSPDTSKLPTIFATSTSVPAESDDVANALG